MFTDTKLKWFILIMWQIGLYIYIFLIIFGLYRLYEKVDFNEIWQADNVLYIVVWKMTVLVYIEKWKVVYIDKMAKCCLLITY